MKSFEFITGIRDPHKRNYAIKYCAYLNAKIVQPRSSDFGIAEETARCIRNELRRLVIGKREDGQ